MKKPTSDPKPKSTYSGIVPAVEEASRILITLARNNSGKMTLTQIRKEVGIHNSKAFSILNTLQKFGFVQKDPVSKTYSLGMGLIYLSQKVLDSLDLRDAASPFLSRLSSGTNSTAFLGLIAGNYVYVAAKDEGSQAVAVTFRIGQRFPLFLGHPRQSHTGVSVRRRAERNPGGRQPGLPWSRIHIRLTASWRKNLLLCRKFGYAVDLDETKVGIRSVAAPVFGPTAKLIGAFVVIGTFPEDVADELREARGTERPRSFRSSLEGSPNPTERV